MEIDDNYEHLEASLEYVLENVLYDHIYTDEREEFDALKELYNSTLCNLCSCSPDVNCTSCFHSGNYSLNEDCKSLELVINRVVRSDLIYECSSLCGCNISQCQNRLVQYGPRKNLKIVDSEVYRSKGIVTIADIPSGAFVCEYAGELLTRKEARRRIEINERKNKMNYILCLKEIGIGGRSDRRDITIVDPSRRGNIGRYLNHSCDPNCDIYSVRVDCPVPKIAIFARRNISAGEELCFHYSGEVQSDESTIEKEIKGLGIPCLCSSPQCAKYLPKIDF